MITGLVDPMAYMIALGLAGSAFIILVFATWTTNSVNLYSTTLAVAVVRTKTPEWQLMLVSGAVGTGWPCWVLPIISSNFWSGWA